MKMYLSPNDPVTPNWISAQYWTQPEKKRADAILDRRTRMEKTITVAELSRVMGKPVPG